MRADVHADTRRNVKQNASDCLTHSHSNRHIDQIFRKGRLFRWTFTTTAGGISDASYCSLVDLTVQTNVNVNVTLIITHIDRLLCVDRLKNERAEKSDHRD